MSKTVSKIEKEVVKFIIKDFEQAQEFIAAITEMSQPVYIYPSISDDISKIVVSNVALKDIEIEQALEDIVKKEVIDELDDLIWADGEDVDFDWLVM